MKLIKTSKKEIIDLTKAWVILSLAFAILLTRRPIVSSVLASNFLIAGLTVGIGFVFHELAHKFLAQKYGCFAEFRSFDVMLFLALIMSFFGFILAAPGGVFIKGEVGIARNGKISAAGIATNIAIALIFLLLYILTPFTTLAYFGFFINSLLALFNLIPIGNFDGVKVLRWDKKVYTLMIISAGILMAIQPFLRPL